MNKLHIGHATVRYVDFEASDNRLQMLIDMGVPLNDPDYDIEVDVQNQSANWDDAIFRYIWRVAV